MSSKKAKKVSGRAGKEFVSDLEALCRKHSIRLVPGYSDLYDWNDEANDRYVYFESYKWGSEDSCDLDSKSECFSYTEPPAPPLSAAKQRKVDKEREKRAEEIRQQRLRNERKRARQEAARIKKDPDYATFRKHVCVDPEAQRIFLNPDSELEDFYLPGHKLYTFIMDLFEEPAFLPYPQPMTQEAVVIAYAPIDGWEIDQKLLIHVGRTFAHKGDIPKGL